MEPNRSVGGKRILLLDVMLTVSGTLGVSMGGGNSPSLAVEFCVRATLGCSDASTSRIRRDRTMASVHDDGSVRATAFVIPELHYVLRAEGGLVRFR